MNIQLTLCLNLKEIAFLSSKDNLKKNKNVIEPSTPLELLLGPILIGGASH